MSYRSISPWSSSSSPTLSVYSSIAEPTHLPLPLVARHRGMADTLSAPSVLTQPPWRTRRGLTPACSGLATLAADARRYADNGSSSRAMTFQRLRVPCCAVTSSDVPAGWTAAPCGTSKALAVVPFVHISSFSRLTSASTGATRAPLRQKRSRALALFSSRLSSVASTRLSRSTGAQPAGGHPGRVVL